MRIKLRLNKSKLQLLSVVLLSLITATTAFVYTNGVESRVRSEQELVPVLIVGQTIPVGTSLSKAFSEGLVQFRELPRQSLPNLAISSISNSNGELVALHELQPGQFVTTPNFGVRATNTSALKIPQGMLAVTVTVGEPEKVATFLQPGSEIAIFATSDDTGTTGKSKITKVLFTQIQVLAIGNQIIPNTDAQAPATSSGLITLAVTPNQALKLINATRSLSLYFALRSDGVDFGELTSITSAEIPGQ